MSTILLLILAMAIIFWHPPFQIPDRIKQISRPIILVILIIILFVIGAVKSFSRKTIHQSSVIKIECSDKAINKPIVR